MTCIGLDKLALTLVISEQEAGPKSIIELAAQAFSGGATALQLREKNNGDRLFYEKAVKIREFCHNEKRLFIINDRLDIALGTDADGLHLGQSDLPARVAAAILPKNKILGVSVTNLDEAKQAIEDGADYLGVGALFATNSKDDALQVEHSLIKAIIKLGTPCVAIGGITVDNAAQVWKMGFEGLAVISALTSSPTPQKTAELLLKR